MTDSIEEENEYIEKVVNVARHFDTEQVFTIPSPLEVQDGGAVPKYELEFTIKVRGDTIGEGRHIVIQTIVPVIPDPAGPFEFKVIQEHDDFDDWSPQRLASTRLCLGMENAHFSDHTESDGLFTVTVVDE